MAVYHDVEEFSYGPGCKLPARARVFYCMRHKLLRDGLCEKQIGKEYIMEKTGLSVSQVKIALRYLEEKEIILVKRMSMGKVHYENEYQLNPKKFPALFNWYKNNPTFRVYDTEKTNKSYPHVGSESTPGVGSYSARGVVPDSTPGKTLNYSELMEKTRRKNPSYKNPSLKNPSKSKKTEESFTQKEWNREPTEGDIQREKTKQLSALADLQKKGLA